MPENEYDIVWHYRGQTPLEAQIEIYEEMLSYERNPRVQDKLRSTRRKQLFPKVETEMLLKSS